MTEVFNDLSHPLFEDLLKAKGDQVAQILKHMCKGWLTDVGEWPHLTEARFDRNTKKKQCTFSIFSNIGPKFGLPEAEEPFFQLEVDRSTKMKKPMTSVPHKFGLSDSILEYPVLRDMSYPYLFLVTALLRGRGCIPVGLYLEEQNDRLQFDMRNGPDLYRIYIWQNRLIREYNQIIEIDPSFHQPRDGRMDSYRSPTNEPEEIEGEDEDEGIVLSAEATAHA